MKINLRKQLLLGSAIVAVGAFGAGVANAAALGFAGTDANPTVVDPDAGGADTLSGDNDGGAAGIDLSAAAETVASITVGDDDNTQDDYDIYIYGGNSLTVTGNTSVVDDSTGNYDTLTFHVGGEDSTVATTTATTLTFTGNVAPSANSNVTIDIVTADATSADTINFNGATVDLGAGGMTLTNAADTVVFGGTAAQTFTGTIDGSATAGGEGIIDINNTGGTTFEGNIGGTQAVASVSVADDVTATFQSNLITDAASASVTDISLESTDATIVFDTQTGTAGAITVTGYIDGTAAAYGVLTVKDSDTSSADAVTFNQAVGANHSLATVNIGTDGAAAGGTADFKGTVAATTINVAAGTGANNAAVATFEEAVTATTINILADDTGTDATATFEGNVTGAIVLDSIDATDLATAVFNTEVDDTGDIVVSGTINGTDGDDGIVTVTDEVATTDDTVTFSSAIGATNNLSNINVGASAKGGHAVFNSTVNSDEIDVGAADMGDDNATADFNGNVTAANGITITAESTAAAGNTAVTFAGDVTAAIDFVDGTADDAAKATVTYDGATQSQTGAITTGADGEGQVTVAAGSTTTFSAAIGATGSALEKVTIAGIANIVNNIYAEEGAGTDAAIDIDGTLNIDSTNNAVSVVAEDQGDIDIDGTVSITGTNVVDFTSASDIFIDGTFKSELTSVALTLASTGDNVAVAGTSDTTMTLANAVTLNGDLAVSGNTGKTFTLNVKQTATYDPTTTAAITAAGDTVDIDSDGTLKVGIDADSLDFDNNDVITFIDSDENVELDNVDTTYTALIASGDVVLVDSGLIDLQHDTTSTVAQDLVAKVVFKDASTVYGNVQGATAANSLIALTSAQAGTIGGNLDTIRDDLLAATESAGKEIAEAIAPTADAGAFAAGTSVVNRATGINNARLASLRDGSATGMAAGNISQGLKAWAQAFGTTGQQDARDGIDGYDVDTYGFAVGVDTETLAEDWVWGMAFSYADSEIDSKNANTTKTELDTYQLTLYADYDLDDATYVSGQVGYAWGQADQTRHAVGGLAGVNAKSDYDTDQWLARLEAGRSYAMDGGMKLTPKALVNYVHYEADNYTETGAGTANLAVDSDDMDLFEVGLGAELAWNLQQADGAYLQPSVELGVRHDLIGDEYASTASFTGGGASFKTKGADPAQTTFNVGAGVTYFSTTNWELSAEYDFEYKSDYDAHSGLLKAAYKF